MHYKRKQLLLTGAGGIRRGIRRGITPSPRQEWNDDVLLIALVVVLVSLVILVFLVVLIVLAVVTIFVVIVSIVVTIPTIVIARLNTTAILRATTGKSLCGREARQ
jgi:hypothetical protein